MTLQCRSIEAAIRPTVSSWVLVQVGSVAPDFTVKDEGGNEVTLASLKGKNVVLYFYPKDNTVSNPCLLTGSRCPRLRLRSTCDVALRGLTRIAQ